MSKTNGKTEIVYHRNKEIREVINYFVILLLVKEQKFFSQFSRKENKCKKAKY